MIICLKANIITPCGRIITQTAFAHYDSADAEYDNARVARALWRGDARIKKRNGISYSQPLPTRLFAPPSPARGRLFKFWSKLPLVRRLRAGGGGIACTI